MTPSRDQVPPRGVVTSQRACAGPPDASIFFIFPPEKKPINRLSGDRTLLGEHASGPTIRTLSWAATLVLITCVVALAVVSLT